MARIRTIKPEFFTSTDITALSPLARLLYIGLWCEADREGRMKWSPAAFKLRYLPADKCGIAPLCQELIAGGLVVLYGEGLAFVPAFKEHQNVNPRESESRLPSPPDDAVSRVTDASLRVSDAQRGREGVGREGKGREGKTRDAASIGLPASLDTPAFRSALGEWFEYRKDSKNGGPWSDKTLELNLREWAESWGPERAIAALYFTMKKGWQGIREPDARDKPTAPPVQFPERRNAAAEAMARQRAEREAEAQAEASKEIA